ncbi:MAG: hypothetical protein ACPGF8_06860 [Opitutales bacterium]
MKATLLNETTILIDDERYFAWPDFDHRGIQKLRGLWNPKHLKWLLTENDLFCHAWRKPIPADILHQLRRYPDYHSELLDEANQLSERKQQLRQEIDSTKVEIEYCEQSASDENLIAESLRNFEDACQHLTFEERAEVIGLLVESIGIRCIEPPQAEMEDYVADTIAGGAVQWYQLKIKFHLHGALTEEFARGKSLNARTEVTVIAGLVGSDWDTGGFVVQPFKLNECRLNATSKRVTFITYKKRHLLATALQWREQLNQNPHLKAADIAAQVGLSAIRVRKILRLTLLHSKIQTLILKTPHAVSKRKFSERKLREFTPLTHAEQLTLFHQKWPDQNLDSQ